eukprot:g299.t1
MSSTISSMNDFIRLKGQKDDGRSAGCCGWLRLSVGESSQNVRAFVVICPKLGVYVYSSLAEAVRGREPALFRDRVSGVEEEKFKIGASNFVVRFPRMGHSPATFQIRFRCERSSVNTPNMWIKAFRALCLSAAHDTRAATKARHKGNKSSLVQNLRETGDSSSLEFRLAVLREKALSEFLSVAQTLVPEGALADGELFNDEIRTAFFILANVSRGSRSDCPAPVPWISHARDNNKCAPVVERKDAAAAYVALATSLLCRVSGEASAFAALVEKQTPRAVAPVVPEPIPMTEIEMMSVRPGDMMHWALWPFVPMFGHGMIHGEVSVCIQEASLDNHLEWTCYAAVESALPVSLLVPNSRTGYERARRVWKRCEWGVPTVFPLNAPRSASKLVVALEAADASKRAKKRKTRCVLACEMCLSQIRAQDGARVAIDSEYKERRWGSSVPILAWRTREMDVSFTDLERVRVWSTRRNVVETTGEEEENSKNSNTVDKSIVVPLFDFDNLHIEVSKEKENSGGIVGQGVNAVGQGVNLVGKGIGTGVGMTVSTVGKGVGFVGKTLGGGVGLIGSGVGLVGKGLDGVPLVGKGIGMLGKGIEGVGGGIDVVGDTVGVGLIGRVGEGIKDAPQNVVGLGRGLTNGIGTLIDTIGGPDEWKINDKLVSRIRLKAVLTSNIMAERCCSVGYRANDAASKGDARDSGELEHDLLAIENALGVIGTMASWAPLQLVLSMTRATASFRWLSVSVSVAVLGLCVAAYPYMGKSLLMASAGCVGVASLVVLLVFTIAKRIWAKRKKKQNSVASSSKRLSARLLPSRHVERESSDAIRFAVESLAPFASIELHRLASRIAAATIFALTSALGLSFGSDSFIGLWTQRAVILVGLGLIFRRAAPVFVILEFSRRVYDAALTRP